jgi:hypothetical protein
MNQLPEAVQARFRAIPKLRVERDQDDTHRAIQGRKRPSYADHLYPHSDSLIALYVERPSRYHFKCAIRRYKRMINVQEEFLGDQDGILFFSWDQVHKLRKFHKKKRDLMTYNLNFKRKA